MGEIIVILLSVITVIIFSGIWIIINAIVKIFGGEK